MIKKERLKELLLYFYAFAIGFERFINIPVFKTYRIIAIILFLVICSTKVVLDKYDRLFLSIVIIGILQALVFILMGDGDAALLVNAIMANGFNFICFYSIKNVLVITSNKKLYNALLAFFFSISITCLIIYFNVLTGDRSRQIVYFSNSSYTAMALAFSGLFLIERCYKFLGMNRTALAMGCLGLSFVFFVAILYTGSRAVFYSAFIGLGIFSFNRKAVKSAYLLIVISIVFGLTQIIGGTPAFLEDNVMTRRLEYKSNEDEKEIRNYIWASGLKAFNDNYFMGLGAGQYKAVHLKYFSQSGYDEDEESQDKQLTLHSDYMSFLIEYGIPGLLLYLYFLGSILYDVYMASRTSVNNDLSLLYYYFFVCVVMLSIFGISHQGSGAPVFWFMISLAIASIRNSRKQIWE